MDIDFNSHAHVERDDTRVYIVPLMVISTHTLTWSVTEFVCKKCHDNFISTHTLTWSVTGKKSVGMSVGGNFNSHAHVERDDSRCWYGSRGSISTHTLTWSVTKQIDYANDIRRISTHTLTWSVTQNFGNWVKNILFQLTRSRGA